MTIVCHTHRFVFLKSRKTAGTSVQTSLLPVCGPGDVVTCKWTNLVTDAPCEIEEFATIEEVVQSFGPQCRGYFTFGFTRNPFDLVMSRYFYQIKMNRIPGPAQKDDFNSWLQEIYFVGEPGFPGGRYLKDISRLLLFDAELTPVPDFIGRFETLEADFRTATDRIGLPPISLRHENASNLERQDYRSWLTEKSADLVRRHFAFELDYFGYSF